MDIELFKFFLSLLLAAVTGLVVYFWGRRRARERDLFLLWRNAFDRPAFRGSYLYHTDHEKFRRAISITIKAIATGRLFDSRGTELARVEGVYHGPSQIKNAIRKKAIVNVQNRLQQILVLSISQPNIEQLNNEREEIIKILNKVWKNLGIEAMKLPSQFQDVEIPVVVDEIQRENFD